ncbi:hypothetical protein CANARDRAFT_177479 [[Candida] arabinofermentans NRRL YB-2248]|uniref:Respiratory supercomplex factor 1, mitochondrial n=1 Tax=[Candida] arabinofermentans NRRL YB-2248 TaxID=983967 RepID=A0A1E4SWB7_9ASCO|nr:hypothetical protein CANARDRAFT_177479 [[Candida] arabinofermentans NRRL YB-2248]
MASENYPSSADEPFEDLSPLEKIIFRSKQQPFVPLGCLGTVIAVTLAAKGVRTGDAKGAQVWFRWRVAMQGLTIVALLAGSIYYDKTFREDKSPEQLALEKARMREKLWIEELERRDTEMKERQHRAELARQFKTIYQRKIN